MFISALSYLYPVNQTNWCQLCMKKIIVSNIDREFLSIQSLSLSPPTLPPQPDGPLARDRKGKSAKVGTSLSLLWNQQEYFRNKLCCPTKWWAGLGVRTNMDNLSCVMIDLF